MLFQQCEDDEHPSADELRKKRVRSYIFRRTITPDCPCGCRAATTFILENYLIIDNANVSDAGEYTFTANIFGRDPTTLQRNFSIEVGMFFNTKILTCFPTMFHITYTYISYVAMVTAGCYIAYPPNQYST